MGSYNRSLYVYNILITKKQNKKTTTMFVRGLVAE